MSRRTATVVLIASVVVLSIALIAGLRSGDREPRADLIGAATSAEAPTTATSLPPIRMVPLPATPAPDAADGPRIEQAVSGIVPARLSIPDLGVDAPVVPVGLEPDGSMEIPGASEAGWYEPTGILPGDAAGSAVLAAHVDYQGRRGVFFDLRSLGEGAEVVVSGPDGSERRFRVTERFQVDKDDLPAEELFRTGGPPTLTLITCGGAFDRSVRHYEDNIVVRAVPI